MRTEGTSEVAPEAVREAVGGGCRSGWGRLLSVTSAIEAGTCCQAGHRLGALEGGLPPFPMHPWLWLLVPPTGALLLHGRMFGCIS